jgi:hypothetical protein
MRLDELLAYHGSGNDHAAFDVSHTGNNSTSFSEYESKRYGIFFTSNPKFAAIYGAVIEYDLTINNTIDLNGSGISDLLYDFSEDADDFEDGLRNETLNVARGHSEVWELFENSLGKYFVAYLKDMGYDSATFMEDHEDPENDGDHIESKTIVVFNPSNIIKNGQLEMNLYDNVITKGYSS